MNKLDTLNQVAEIEALEMVRPLIERAPDVAAKVVCRRPFGNISEFLQAIKTELQALNKGQLVELFKAHPELAPENPMTMTNDSKSEQARLNLTSRTNEYRARLDELNEQYYQKFGFPFITALVRHSDMESVMADFESRLLNERKVELKQSLEEIVMVSQARVESMFGIGKTDVSPDDDSVQTQHE